MMLVEYSVSHTQLGGNVPLHIASFKGKLDVVRVLTNFNANINLQNDVSI